MSILIIDKIITDGIKSNSYTSLELGRPTCHADDCKCLTPTDYFPIKIVLSNSSGCKSSLWDTPVPPRLKKLHLFIENIMLSND